MLKKVSFLVLTFFNITFLANQVSSCAFKQTFKKLSRDISNWDISPLTGLTNDVITNYAFNNKNNFDEIKYNNHTFQLWTPKDIISYGFPGAGHEICEKYKFVQARPLFDAIFYSYELKSKDYQFIPKDSNFKDAAKKINKTFKLKFYDFRQLDSRNKNYLNDEGNDNKEFKKNVKIEIPNFIASSKESFMLKFYVDLNLKNFNEISKNSAFRWSNESKKPLTIIIFLLYSF